MIKKRRFWFALVLTVAFGYLILRIGTLQNVGGLLKKADPCYLSVTLLLIILTFLVKSVAWFFLMRPATNKTRVHRLFSSMMIGYAAENALGIRLRELFRAIAADAIEGTRFFTVLATVALHRALEGVIIVLSTLLIAGVFVSLPKENDWPVKLSCATGVFFLIVIVAFKILRDEDSWASSAVKAVLKWLLQDHYEIGLRYYRDFIKGLAALKRWQPIAMALLFSIIARILQAGYFWTMAKAIGTGLSASSSMFLTGIASLRVFLPSHMVSGTPQFQDLLSWNLVKTFHFTNEAASSFGYYLVIMTLFVTSFFGLLCLFLEAFRKRRVSRR